MSTMPPPSEPAAEVTTVDVRRSWPWVLALGILSLIAGIITLVWPSVTVYALVFVLGVFLIVAGGAEIGWSIAERHTDGWGFILFRGVVDLIAGIVVLAWPDVTALVLALLLAAWLFVYAAMTLYYAYRHRGERPHTGHFVAKGIAALVVAVITVAWPGITILVVALVIGFMLIFWGAVLTRFAFVLRRQPAA
ncbi:MAG TPA: HdeD family acid-resistance protein [Acidimicrobiia bacterium]|nr:HdeD family acid-resistance protein [Acidimicrobiia bacterium]